jgi:hypothetical protein
MTEPRQVWTRVHVLISSWRLLSTTLYVNIVLRQSPIGRLFSQFVQTHWACRPRLGRIAPHERLQTRSGRLYEHAALKDSREIARMVGR